MLDIIRLLDAVIFSALTGNAAAHAKNFSFLYADGTRRMAPLYDQVCTLAWPELSKSLSMKIGSAGSLAEVSPEHFKQLSTDARLGWPMVRERLINLCTKMAATNPACVMLKQARDGNFYHGFSPSTRLSPSSDNNPASRKALAREI